MTNPINSFSRRSLLRFGTLALTLGVQHAARGAEILAVRIWPSKDYSRVTIESAGELKARQFFIPEPPRLAVDIEGVDLIPALRDLVAKVRSDDPNISGIRAGQNAPGVVRLVIDLKQPVQPQVFTLAPVSAYQHRLVFDLYPSVPIDPLEALIAERLQDTRSPGLAADPLGELMSEQARRLAQGAAAGKLPLPAAAPLALPLPALKSAQEDASKVMPGEGKPGNSDRDRSPGKTDRLVIVALDPGHGGEDPGAIGPGGTREKDVVLQIALLLRERINQQPNMRAFLTRDADYFVPLHVRVQKARRVQADLFISIHADAFFSERPQGASVFVLSERGASSSSARWLADKENSADLVGGLNVRAKDAQVQKILLDMSTTAQISDSLKLGGAMLGEIGNVGKLHKPRVEQAGFAVLKAPDIPSVLVETAFISNPDEEAKLRSEAYQVQLANALMRGISRYFARNPPLARNRTL